MALYGGGATLLQANLLMIGFDLAFLPSVMAFLPSLHRIMDAPPDLPLPPHPLPAPGPIGDGLAFHHVSFAYPGTTRPFLEDVSFRLAPDQILVLEGGRIVEAGSHDTLLARRGRYATPFELQAGRYR